ncbi:hypothetical protein RSSL_01686 [Streptococcus salivarius K12]|uniref:Uncharacterized protein n=1 Tax=Streptococcus salivarius K12 TaxID=1200793 RepID=J7TQL9_STRSL|nr:hypothetical protein RSSL_01686 [Streptococcus salivarius K12]
MRACHALFSVSFTALVVVNNYKNLKGMVNAKKKRRNLWLIFGLISDVILSG